MIYCERRAKDKSSFDKRSFRTKRSGKATLLVACPKGAWQPRKQRCTMGMQLYRILTPAKGRRCPVGARRIRK